MIANVYNKCMRVNNVLNCLAYVQILNFAHFGP